MVSGSDILTKLRKDARKIFYGGLGAADPAASIERYCVLNGRRWSVGGSFYDLETFRNLYLIGTGKAGAPMARALEYMLGDFITTGQITVKYGHTVPLEGIEIIEAGHPVPDFRGREGAEAIMKIATTAGKNDLLICVISGGGSALLPMPAEGLSMADKQETIRLLLSSGATIHEINAIRKHISGIKGGRLAEAAYPATVVSLILSDVVGDDLDVIASGPTVSDPSTYLDCMKICRSYDIDKKLPKSVMDHLRAGADGRRPETPKPGHRSLHRVQNMIVGSNTEAVSAAKKTAESLGYNTMILSTMIEGETRDVGKLHAAVAKEIIKTGHPIKKPACMLSGGETTVKLAGKGKGGRNQELVLAAAMGIGGDKWVTILSGGTDGTDGPTDAAGAIADNETMASALKLGMNPSDFLSNNDSYHFFKPLDDLLITGPTNTNVMDLRILLVV